jgi:hypothetical protein
MVLGVPGTIMKSATYARRVKNSREIVGVSTVTFGSKNEPDPDPAVYFVNAMFIFLSGVTNRWQNALLLNEVAKGDGDSNKSLERRGMAYAPERDRSVFVLVSHRVLLGG